MKLRNLFLCTGLGLTLAACGGSSSSNDPLPSLYAGTWTGTWTGPLANDGGAITYTVSNDGSFTGTMARSTGVSGSWTGVITGTGQMTSTTGFGSGGNFLIRGTVVTVPPSTMTGNFDYSWLGHDYTGTFTATTSATVAKQVGATRS